MLGARGLVRPVAENLWDSIDDGKFIVRECSLHITVWPAVPPVWGRTVINRRSNILKIAKLLVLKRTARRIREWERGRNGGEMLRVGLTSVPVLALSSTGVAEQW